MQRDGDVVNFIVFHPEQPLTEMEVQGMSEPTEERVHFFKFVSERWKAFQFFFPQAHFRV